MKKNCLTIIILLISIILTAKEYNHHFLLAGASFAVPENGWFELTCEAFNAEAINKSVSGEAIKHTAIDMYNETFYSQDELEKIDAFIIMHVHNQNVANTSGIKENYKDYTLTEIEQYHLAYDYVIKKYKADCYNLRNNPASAYYNTNHGKPATIILCTHWHDSRTQYNTAIRALAQKWNVPLIKWDDKVGFTRTITESDGSQPSLKYSLDSENIYGIKFGWHPLRGKGQYIQKKLSWIAMETLEELFGILTASASVRNKNKLIMKNEEASVFFTLTGVPPWNLSYSVNSQNVDITCNEDIICPTITFEGDSAVVAPTAISNGSCSSGALSDQAVIYRTDHKLLPTMETYVYMVEPSKEFNTEEFVQVKGNTPTHTREALISFNLNNKITTSHQLITFRAYYYRCVYPTGVNIKEPHTVQIAGNTESYVGKTINWNNKPSNFTPITEALIQPSELDSYVEWDITNWIKEQIADGKENITLRLKIVSGNASGLLHFYTSRSTTSLQPQLLYYSNLALNSPYMPTEKESVDIDSKNKRISISGMALKSTIRLISTSGAVLYQSVASAQQQTIEIPEVLPGIYLLQIYSEERHSAHKIAI